MKNKDGLIFNIDSNSIDSFSCSYSDGLKVWAGRLYIFREHICFYSNLLVTNTKFTMSIYEITNIENKSNKLLSSIDIQTDKKKYSFISFVYREEAYKKLVEVWQKKTDLPIDKKNISEQKGSEEDELKNEMIGGWELINTNSRMLGDLPTTRKRSSSAPSQIDLLKQEELSALQPNLSVDQHVPKMELKKLSLTEKDQKDERKNKLMIDLKEMIEKEKEKEKEKLEKEKLEKERLEKEKLEKNKISPRDNTPIPNKTVPPLNNTSNSNQKKNPKKPSNEENYGDVEMKSIVMKSPNKNNLLTGSVMIDEEEDNPPPIVKSIPRNPEVVPVIEQNKEEVKKEEERPKEVEKLPWKPPQVGNCEHWTDHKSTHEPVETSLDISLEKFVNLFLDKEGACFCEYHKKRNFGGKNNEYLVEYPYTETQGCCCYVRQLTLLITTKGGTYFPDTTTRAKVTHRWCFKDEKTMYFHSSSEALDIPIMVRGKFTAECRMIVTEDEKGQKVNVKFFFEPKFLGMTFGLSKFIGKKCEDEGREYWMPLVEFWKTKIEEQQEEEILSEPSPILKKKKISENLDVDPLTNTSIPKPHTPSPILQRASNHQRKNSNNSPIIGMRHSSSGNIIGRPFNLASYSFNNLFFFLFLFLFFFFIWSSHKQNTQILKLQEKLMLAHHLTHSFDSKMEAFLLSLSKNLTKQSSDKLEKHWEKFWREKMDLMGEEKHFFEDYFQKIAQKNKERSEVRKNEKAREILDLIKQYFDD